MLLIWQLNLQRCRKSSKISICFYLRNLKLSQNVGVTKSRVQTRPTGFQHVQLGINTSKHVQRCVQTRPIMYAAIVFNFAI